MTDDITPNPTEPAEPADDIEDALDGPLIPEPPHPINWNLLTSEEAEAEWLELNRWVDWLRRTYGLPASVIPPFWHHHPELVWELSALHLHWLCAYDPEQNGSAPLGWHRDFADARQRLRDWVAACSTRLDRDRPTRQTSWPGEEPPRAGRGHDHCPSRAGLRAVRPRRRHRPPAGRGRVLRRPRPQDRGGLLTVYRSAGPVHSQEAATRSPGGYEPSSSSRMSTVMGSTSSAETT